jgi:hypothetical protein
MFHSHPALVEAMRADNLRLVNDRHGVPGDDFDGVMPRTRSRSARKAARRDER